MFSAEAVTVPVPIQERIFGLGTATRIDKLEVIWPDGKKQEVPPPETDQIITVKEQPDAN